jgi:hypothetical protein
MKAEFCARCESVGRKPKKNAIHEIEKDGLIIKICDTCLDEIEEEETEKMYFLNEIQENEDAY